MLMLALAGSVACAWKISFKMLFKIGVIRVVNLESKDREN